MNPGINIPIFIFRYNDEAIHNIQTYVIITFHHAPRVYLFNNEQTQFCNDFTRFLINKFI